MTGNRADALARLDVFVGEWVVEVRFRGDGDAPVAHSTFEWALDRQFLIQRTEVPVPEAPDGLMIVSADRRPARIPSITTTPAAWCASTR